MALPSSTLAQPDELCSELAQQLSILYSKEFLFSIWDHCSAELQQPEPTLRELHVVCVILDTILCKWPSKAQGVLNTLVFSSQVSIIELLWKAIKNSGPFHGVMGSSTTSNEWLTHLIQLADVVSLFCATYSHLLIILDDEDFFANKPLQLSEVADMVRFLKQLLFAFFWTDYQLSSNEASSPLPPSLVSTRSEAKEMDEQEEVVVSGFMRVPSGTSKGPSRLAKRATALFRQLRDRQARRSFCQPHDWLMSSIPVLIFQDEFDRGTVRAGNLIREIPFVLSFNDRVTLFYAKIEQDKRDSGAYDHGLYGGHNSVKATIRREHLMQDGYETLYNLGARLKGRVQVTFVDEHGNEEAGIDGGGLFKEFLTSLLRNAFEPKTGLFTETDTHFAYPNPNSAYSQEIDGHLNYFSFIGRIVGKALYEGIQVEPQFALFFLNKVLGKQNYTDDLESLDPVMYKNLIFLKKYDGDFKDLGLNFTIDKTIFGDNVEIELIPNGANIPVTEESVARYIYHMADFKVNREIKDQAQAFVSGMHEIVGVSLLRMFSSDELRLLVCGAPHIDIGDLKAHTNYANGYSESHEAIKWMWEALTEFDASEQAAFLRFVTSCSRAPLQGFSKLYPRFCIQHSDAGPDQETLPTASTCMNLLRLPRYFSRERLREKLLYAITSGTGFNLS